MGKLKKYFCVLLIVLTSLTAKVAYAFPVSIDDVKNVLTFNIYKNTAVKINQDKLKVSKNEGQVNIFYKSSLPQDLRLQKNIAYKIFEEYFKENPSKIVLFWQVDKLEYGKKFCITKVYIEDYLANKITKDEFIKAFATRSIEPVSLNDLKKIVKLKQVDDERIVGSAHLRSEAQVYRLSGEYDSALRLYNEAIEENPNDYLSMFWIAEIYSAQQKSDKAIEYYKKSLSIAPDFVSAQYSLRKLGANDK